MDIDIAVYVAIFVLGVIVGWIFRVRSLTILGDLNRAICDIRGKKASLIENLKWLITELKKYKSVRNVVVSTVEKENKNPTNEQMRERWFEWQ